MKKFSVKNINYVGAIASILAFIFTFIPFYKVQPTAFFINFSGTASLFSIEKNLVSYNVFGVLCLIFALASCALFVLNFNQKVKIASIITSFMGFVSLMLAVIVGNGDIEDLEASVESFVYYSDSTYAVNAFIKSSLSIGFTLELIAVLIMIASYWIDVMVIRPYILGDKSEIKINPLEGIDSKSHSIKLHNEQHIIKAPGTEIEENNKEN